jgi:hypothetical protein
VNSTRAIMQSHSLPSRTCGYILGGLIARRGVKRALAVSAPILDQLRVWLMTICLQASQGHRHEVPPQQRRFLETRTGVDSRAEMRTQTSLVRFAVFTAVSRKNAVFWDVAPCRSCGNRCFRGTYRLHLQGRKIRERGTSVSHRVQRA